MGRSHPPKTSHCHYGFRVKYLFPFVPIYYATKFLANIKVKQMCVTSSDTGLRNANINTIYQITIVSHQDKKGGGGSGGVGESRSGKK